MLNSLDMDDFDGSFCDQGIYPLLTTLFDQFQAPLPPTTILTTYLESVMTNANGVSTTDIADSTSATYSTETFDYNATYFEDFVNTTEPYFESTTTNSNTETPEPTTFESTTAEATTTGMTQITTPIYSEPTTTELTTTSNFRRDNQQSKMVYNEINTTTNNLPFPRVLDMKQDAIFSESTQTRRRTNLFSTDDKKNTPENTPVLDSFLLRKTAAQKPAVDKSMPVVKPSGLQLTENEANVLPVSPLSLKTKHKNEIATITHGNVPDRKHVSSPKNRKRIMHDETVFTTPINGHDILNFVHKNGNSKRGRVLRTDTIFNSIRKDSASTLGNLRKRKENADKINVVRPRFVFPVARKSQTTRRTNQQTVRQIIQPRTSRKINRVQTRRRIAPLRISSNADPPETVRRISQSPTSRTTKQEQANRRTNPPQTVRRRNQSQISKPANQLQKSSRSAQTQTSRNANLAPSNRGTNWLQPDRGINTPQASRRLDQQPIRRRTDQLQTSGTSSEVRPVRKTDQQQTNRRINLSQINRITGQQQTNRRMNQAQVSRSTGQQQINRINQPQISRRTDQQQMTGIEKQPTNPKASRRTTKLRQPSRIINQPQIVKPKQNNRQINRQNTSFKKTSALDKRGMTAKKTDKGHEPFKPVSFQVPSAKDTKPVLSFVDFKELGIHVVIPKPK